MPFDAAFCSDELLSAAKGLADHYHTGHHPAPVEPSRDGADVPRQLWQAPVEYWKIWASSVPTCSWRTSSTSMMREIDAIARTDTKTVMCPTAALKMARA